MLELNAHQFVNGLRAVVGSEAALAEWSPEQLERETGPGVDNAGFTRHLDQFAEACDVLGARITKKALLELSLNILGGKMKWREVGEEMRAIRKTFNRELEAIRLFAFRQEDAWYFDESIDAFGHAVTAAFPLAVSEIDEAGKCLALGRAGAAIFHLMRIVEVGLRALAPPLGIAEPNPDWGLLIRTVDEYLKRPKAQKTLGLSDEFLAGVSAQMHAVKLAWRNQVMHVDTTFSLDNARNIFSATKALMQHLATELSEPSASAPAS